MDRPPNRDARETEDQRLPAREGEPPRPATEPPGGDHTAKQAPTQTDPGTGAPQD